jgi:hypothetical protein
MSPPSESSESSSLRRADRRKGSGGSSPLQPACLAAALGVLWQVLVGGSTAQAQTIADYGRSQRAVLQATMTQNAARAATLAASAASTPTAAASPAVPAPGVAAPPLGPRRSLADVEPVIHVTGTFASASRTVAEVAVDDRVYLLASGQPVPGTAWHVASIAPERVVLARAAERREDGAALPGSRTFVLAASR